MNALVSFCILAYNQEDFIEVAVNAVLNQSYSPIEIIISDDFSKDKTFEVIRNVVAKYNGPHRIVLNRNSKNLGISAHVNKVCYELAHGDYIAFAGGDDISASNRIERSMNAFEMYPDLTSVSCESQLVDTNLNPLNIGKSLRSSDSVMTIDDYFTYKKWFLFSGDSRVVKRSVIDLFPPLESAKAEDIHIFIRSLILGSVCYIREPLVIRRIHGNNVSLKRFTHSVLKAEYQQQINDISYALKKGLINEPIAKCLHAKVKYIRFYFTISSLYTYRFSRHIRIIFSKLIKKWIIS